MSLRQRRIQRTAKKARPSLLNFETLERRDTPTGIFATVSPIGTAASVTIHDATTWSTIATVSPFNGFTGGISTAIADVNGDGTDDVVVAEGVGGSPTLAMYSGVDGSLIRTLTIGDSTSTEGASVAAAGKDTSSNVLLAVGTISSGVATVEIVKATDGTVVRSLQPFGGFQRFALHLHR